MSKKDNRKFAVIMAYLVSQIREFTAIEERIFTRLNLRHNKKMCGLLTKVAKQMAIYYLEFLRGNLSLDRLEKYLKKEIRLVYVISRERSGIPNLLPLENEERLIKNQVEFLFNFVKPIFINFENTDELINVLNGAECLAIERNSHPVAIFLNHRGDLLKRLYPNPQKLREALERLLSNFSIKKKLEQEITPAISSPQDIQIGEGVLSQERNQIKIDPKKQKRMRELAIAFDIVLNNRVKEIITEFPAC